MRTLSIVISAVIAWLAPSAAAAADAEAVLAADRALARTVAERDLAAFAELIDEAAVFHDGPRVLEGRDAVVAGWADLFAPDRSQRLEWTPRRAEIARSGELGVSFGDYVLTISEDGVERALTGAYVTVWRRGTDGRWRVLADSGTVPSARPPAPSDSPPPPL